MFPVTQGNTQICSPFGSYVIEQHDAGWRARVIDDLPRPDVKFGPAHPLGQRVEHENRAD